MNSPVIKDWLELPDKVLLPLEQLIGTEPQLQPQIQPISVPCLWDLQIR